MSAERSINQLQGQKYGLLSKALRSKNFKYADLSSQKRRKFDYCSPDFASNNLENGKRGIDDGGIGSAENQALPGISKQDESENLQTKGGT